MADTKISALPASTTPLAGTEVLPVVQSGVTKQVSVANLTAGRAVSASTLSATGGVAMTGASNPGWSGFSANQIGNGAVFANPTLSQVYVGSNLYYDGGNFRFINAAAASYMSQVNGAYGWFTSTGTPSAGGVASFVQNMGMDASGNVTLNTGNLVQGTAGKGITQSATNGDLLIAANGTGVVKNTSNYVQGSGSSWLNKFQNLVTSASYGVAKDLATIYVSDSYNSFGRIVITVTAENLDSNFGYSAACSVREILFSKYGGSFRIIKDTELENNQGSINSGIINVTLATSVSASGDTLTVSATPSVSGSVGSTNAAMLIDIETQCALQIPTITFL